MLTYDRRVPDCRTSDIDTISFGSWWSHRRNERVVDGEKKETIRLLDEQDDLSDLSTIDFERNTVITKHNH